MTWLGKLILDIWRWDPWMPLAHGVNCKPLYVVLELDIYSSAVRIPQHHLARWNHLNEEQYAAFVAAIASQQRTLLPEFERTF
ncbi:MAG: hypothetical protein HOE53_04760 [Candidatus Magasanikbacteria bacterium]|nr:hypothetical protein [Candidatus Magasanikbacteria bacterium]